MTQAEAAASEDAAQVHPANQNSSLNGLHLELRTNKVNQAPTNKVSIRTSHIRTHHHASQISLFHQVYFTFR